MAMTKLQARRLMNVARACRESKTPQLFSMRQYVNGECFSDARVGSCNTPGCALGHYGFRPDLQQLLKYSSTWLTYADTGRDIGVFETDTQIPDARILEHFGIDADDAVALFSSEGCDGATTPGQAARYIERFVMARIGARLYQETGERSKKALRRWLGMNWQPGLLGRAS